MFMTKILLEAFSAIWTRFTGFKKNHFHPLVWINGEPEIAASVYIGGFSEINCNNAKCKIGEECDIASFVSINCADSHKRCLGLKNEIERKDIIIENHVFIGTFSVIKGGALIGHHSVIAAGTIVDPGVIPPYSLVSGNPMVVKKGYYKHEYDNLA